MFGGGREGGRRGGRRGILGTPHPTPPRPQESHPGKDPRPSRGGFGEESLAGLFRVLKCNSPGPGRSLARAPPPPCARP